MASDNEVPGLPPKPPSKPPTKPPIPPRIRSVPPNTTGIISRKASTASNYRPPIPPRPKSSLVRAALGKKPQPLPKPRSLLLHLASTKEHDIAFHQTKSYSTVEMKKVSLPHVWGNEPTTAPIPSQSPRLEKRNVVLSDTLPLQELGHKYSKSLPLQIEVQRGYSGQSSNITISKTDIFNVHCAKRQKVIRIKDSQGSVYSIPMNSSIKIGLVYEPSGGETKNEEPLIFPRVSDLLAVSTLPKVICATKAFKGADIKTSVQENEILVVCQAHRPKLLRKKYIEAFSLVSRTQKLLDAECEGHFSTKPTLVGLHIPELIEFLPTAFPCEAFLLAEATLESDLRCLSNSTISTPVTILEAKTETSLIASPVLFPEMVPPDSMENEAQLLDIPLDHVLSDVEVAVFVMEKSEIEKLHDETRKVLDTLDLHKLKSYKDVASDRLYEVQSLFYTSIKVGDDTIGVEVDMPILVCEPNVRTKKESTPVQEESDLETDSDDEYVKMVSPLSKEGVLVLPENSDWTTSLAAFNLDERVRMPTPSPCSSPDLISGTEEYAIIREHGFLHQIRLDQLEQGSLSRKQVLSKIEPEITEIKSALLRLGKRFELLEGMIKDLPQSPTEPIAIKEETSEADETESNLLYLRSLDVSQIQQFLAAMKLEQYQAKFLEEQISGEILAELGEKELEQELGVSSRVHRLRLLKIAAGLHRAKTE